MLTQILHTVAFLFMGVVVLAGSAIALMPIAG